jgi:hypothetical protein
MAIEIRVKDLWPSQFVDFLVGAGQTPISVKIRTTPQDAAIMWAIKPLNEFSGTVDPSAGSSKEFNFTPNVTTARMGLRAGSRAPNVAVGYLISVVLPGSGGRQESAIVEIQQDEQSILRQEYVDYAAPPPPAGMAGLPPAVPARTALTLHTGQFNVGNYRYVVNLMDMQNRFNAIVTAYRGRNVNVSGQVVQIPQTAGVDLRSAYRNPQRNRAVGSNHLDSRHVTGRALDLVPATPVTVFIGGHPVQLGLHTQLYPALAAAAATQGTAIAESGATIQVPVGNASEDHIHVQW